MPTKSAVARTFERAAETLGGVAQLAARLGTPLADVERWIAGVPPPPGNDVFIVALDIVSAGPFKDH
jgi:hypothetical protein